MLEEGKKVKAVRESKQEDHSKTASGELAGLVGYHMRMAQVAVFQDFRERLGKFGITPTHLGVLLVVKAKHQISQIDLSRALRIDRSALVGVIDKLESRGLIERGKPLQDRRKNALVINQAGIDLLEELWVELMEHEAAITSRLTEEERTTLVGLLKKIGLPKGHTGAER